MRKQVVALFAVLAVLLTAVVASAVVLKTRELPVTYEVQNQQGDVSAADGYRVSAQYVWNRHPSWHSTYTFGQPEPADSSFRFHSNRVSLYDHAGSFRGADLHNQMFAYQDIYFTDPKDLEEAWKVANEEMPPYLAACLQLQKETPEGSLGTREVKLSELMDYYPVFYSIQINDRVGTWYEVYEWAYSVGVPEQQIMQTYFRIPVLPEETCVLRVDKRAQNGETAAEMLDTSQDSYQMNSAGTVKGNTAYFTFDAHTTQGNLVDTSLIPGGYGLYSISADEENNWVDFDSLTTCMALDPDYYPETMEIDPETGYLHYFAHKESGDRWLMVIDLEKMEILQEIPIMVYEEDSYQWYRTKGATLYCISGGKYMDVFQQNEQGLYEPALHVSLEADAFDYGELQQADFAFHGENVAVVQALGSCNEENSDGDQAWSQKTYGFRLTVLGDTGVQYRGDYLSSLEQKDRGLVFGGYGSQDLTVQVE